MSPAIGFIMSALGVILLTPFVASFARKTGALSAIDFRRRDRLQKSLLGGTGVILASLGVLIVSGGIGSLQPQLLLPTLGIFAFGVYDDFKGINSKAKLLLQILTVGLWSCLIDPKDLLLADLGIHPAISLALSGFWIVGLMNAVNMIDGMDGLASGFGFIACLGLWPLVSGPAQFEIAVVAGACLGFLLWNYSPAKIFLGDSGSQFLGFFLATHAVTSVSTYPSFRSMVLPMLVLALPQMDAVLAMFRRARLKSGVDRADHDHIHHKLQKLGLKVPQAWVVLMGASIYAGLSVFVLREMSDSLRFWMVFTLSVVALLMLLGGVLFLEWKLAHQASEWSGTLLHRHLQSLLKNTLFVPRQDFQAVVYDLFPYYKELQHRGIRDLHSFVDAFAKFLIQNYPKAQFCSIGAYSVAVVVEGKPFEKNQIILGFQNLLTENKLQTTEGSVPWGLLLFVNKGDAEKFKHQFHFIIDVREQERVAA